MHVTPRGDRRGAEAVAQSAPPGTSAAPTAYRVCSGASVVQQVELAICGIEAVSTDAQAEGLALAGQRAARGLSAEPPTSEPSAGWVLHKSGRSARFGAFSFAAVDAQEAADQSLVAQLLCALTGRPAECVVGQRFASQPWQYQPLSRKLIDEAFALTLPTGTSRWEAVDLALAHVTKLSGRAQTPLVEYRLQDAEVLLVAYGEDRQTMTDLVEALRRQGVAAGGLGVALLRPFPEKALAELVSGKRTVVVLGTDDAFAEDVLRSSRGGGDGKGIEQHRAHCDLSEVQSVLGLEEEPAGGTDEPFVNMGVVPAGPQARELLFEALSRVREPVATFSIPAAPDVTAVGIARSVIAEPTEALDLALVAHPSLLDGNLGLRQGARVILVQEAESAAEVVAGLSPGQRKLCEDRALAVDWFNPATASSPSTEPGADWALLQEALLEAAVSTLSERVGLTRFVIPDGVSKPPKSIERLVRLDTKQLPDQRAAEVSFKPPRQRPLLPDASDAPSEEWRMALRRFHLTGVGAAGGAALLPLAPAAATSLARNAPSLYPLVLAEGEDAAIEPFVRVLEGTLESLAKSGTPLAIVAEHKRRLVAAALATVAERGTADLSEVLNAACLRFEAELSLSKKGCIALAEEIRVLKRAMATGGRVLGLGSHAHLEMYAAQVLPERRRRRATLRGQLQQLHQRLADMLQVDDGHSEDAKSPENVAKSLGVMDFVDPAALAQAIKPRQGSKRLPAARRARLEKAAAVLGNYLARMDTLPELFLVSAERVELEPWRVHQVTHPSPLGVAAGLFDGLVREITPVLRCLRIARLEVDSRYDDAVHGPILADFDWTRFEEWELLFLPPVLAVEKAASVWHTSQRSLYDVLQSGRPIHVIVEEAFGVDPEQQPAGLGYALVAQREAVVVQTNLARPEHFARGLSLLASASRPAVAVLAPRPPPGPMPAWVRLAAAHEGRALPCFCYAPDRGLTWADSFDIQDNPAPDEFWSAHELDAEDASGQVQKIVERFTFAHAAALELNYRHHFWSIPPEAWSDEQVPLAEYVDQLLEGDATSVPYIWTTDEQGNLGRAVVSRSLAVESHRRLRLWRVMEELGGARNEHARRAAAAAKDEAQAAAAAQQSELEARHSEELERVRNEVAAEALGRLAQALMDPGALDLAAVTSVPAVEAAPTSVALPMVTEEPSPDTLPEPAAGVEDDDESVSFSDPYIDTLLCTTCNECININPQMFIYNADKQAVLGDVKAGTFLQLVKAAEKCPAACIHPGEPRKDDTTVTDDLVARAAKFN